MRWLSLVAIVIGFVAGRELRPAPAECAPVVVHDTQVVTVPAPAPIVVEDEPDVVDAEPEELEELEEGAPIDLGSVLSQIAQLETTLANGGALQGRITDRETREPIAGATIVAWRPGHDGEQVILTDDAGAYTLAGLPAGMYSVRIYYVDSVTEYTDVVVSSHKVTPLSPELHIYQRHDVDVSFSSGTTIDNSYVVHGIEIVE